MPSTLSGQALTYAFPYEYYGPFTVYLRDRRKQNEIPNENKGIIG